MCLKMEDEKEAEHREQVYGKLNKAFKSVSKVLLRGEVGELKDFEEYLREYSGSTTTRKSLYGGKQVHFACQKYPKGAKFISQGEMEKFEKEVLSRPFGMDSIKDVDSLFGEAAERFAYCGDKHFGNSQLVCGSDTIFDSNCVLDSHEVVGGEYIAYSSNVRTGKYKFGCNFEGGCNFAMRCTAIGWSTRAFEGHMVVHSSDIYFGFQLWHCNECMFSFNQKSKKHMIGNVELEKGKYLELKGKLLGEVEEELRRKKGFPSLFELTKGDWNG